MIKAARFERVAKYPDAILPTRATTGSAGYDFYCAEDTVVPSLPRDLAHIWKVGFGPEVSIEEIVKNHLRPTIIPTGVKCYLDEGYYLNLAVRSSTPLKRLLVLANGEGVIDSDFADSNESEGMIGVMVLNLTPFPQTIKKGEKIAQGMIVPYAITYDDAASETRKGGFGSTSK